MAETKIQWADYTFNGWRGCSKVNADCKNCYAEVNYSVKMQHPFGPCELDLKDKKGGDIDEWPEHLRIRQLPNGAT